MTRTGFVRGDESLAADAEAAVAAAFTNGAPSVPTLMVTLDAHGLHVRVCPLETRSSEEREAAVMRILTTLRAFEGRTASIERHIVS